MLQRIRNLMPWVLRLILLSILPVEWMDSNFVYVAFVALVLCLTFVPALIAHNSKAHLPWLVEFLVVLAFFLDAIGVVYGLYHDVNFWWWDKMTHFIGTITIGLFSFYFIFLLNYVGKIYMSIPMVGLFIFMTSLAIGGVWEIGEYYMDQIFGTNTQISLENTMSDMQFDALGGIVIALCGMLYSKRKRSLWWSNSMKKKS